MANYRDLTGEGKVVCVKCKKIKPRAVFAANRLYLSGHHPYCSECAIGYRHPNAGNEF